MKILTLKSVSELRQLESDVDIIVFHPYMDLEGWIVPYLLEMKFSNRHSNPSRFNIPFMPENADLYAATKVAYPIVTDFVDDERFTSAFNLIIRGARVVMPVTPDNLKHLAFCMAFTSGAYLTHLRQVDNQKFHETVNFDLSVYQPSKPLPLPTLLGYYIEPGKNDKIILWNFDWPISHAFCQRTFNKIIQNFIEDAKVLKKSFEKENGLTADEFSEAVVRPFDHALQNFFKGMRYEHRACNSCNPCNTIHDGIVETLSEKLANDFPPILPSNWKWNLEVLVNMMSTRLSESIKQALSNEALKNSNEWTTALEILKDSLHEIMCRESRKFHLYFRKPHHYYGYNNFKNAHESLLCFAKLSSELQQLPIQTYQNNIIIGEAFDNIIHGFQILKSELLGQPIEGIANKFSQAIPSCNIQSPINNDIRATSEINPNIKDDNQNGTTSNSHATNTSSQTLSELTIKQSSSCSYPVLKIDKDRLKSDNNSGFIDLKNSTFAISFDGLNCTRTKALNVLRILSLWLASREGNGVVFFSNKIHDKFKDSSINQIMVLDKSNNATQLQEHGLFNGLWGKIEPSNVFKRIVSFGILGCQGPYKCRAKEGKPQKNGMNKDQHEKIMNKAFSVCRINVQIGVNQISCSQRILTIAVSIDPDTFLRLAQCNYDPETGVAPSFFQRLENKLLKYP